MSLSVCCFASGSKGNCTFVTDGATNILIDLGISASRAELCLKAVGANPDSVNIIVTHSHSDHIGGLKVFVKKHPTAVVRCQRECAEAIARLTDVLPHTVEREFSVGGITVTSVPVPHDVPCFGYVLYNHRGSAAVVTDVGAMSAATLDALGDCGLIVIESNHDPDMLRANRTYSYPLKMRISGEHGHLSNPDCAKACAYLAGRGVRNFILAHLSEENNTPELALETVTRGIEGVGVFDAHVVCASQNKMTGMYEIC